MSNEISYDELLNRTLGRISSEVDKSEGSLIYDSIAPCVAELYEAYLYIDELEKRVFADTAYDEYLDRRCAERGIYRKEATHAIRKAIFNTDVPVGSRWAKEELVYTVTKKLTDGEFLVRCNDVGAIGNRYDGELVNMDAVEGIESAILTSLIVPGEAEETDEALRKRYFDSFDKEAFGGNIKDYQEKVGSIDGVGQVKVYPVWNGGGTVKLLLLDADNNVPTNELIDMVQTKVDPTQNSGEGLGIAPIGHVVTVAPAEQVDIQVSTSLTFKDVGWDNVKTLVTQSIESYFNSIREKWCDNDAVVRVSQIEARLLDIDGIIDVQNTKLNGAAANIYLSDEQVPELIGVVNE